MKDNFGREIKYLRISLTDRCNLRCRYCMPLEGICKSKHADMLTYDEIINIVKHATKFGIKKIRLTGGEPLVRKDIVSLVENIKKINGIEEVCITTNAVLLSKYIKDLKSAGLDRLNISLDTLDEKKFEYITRIGKLEDVMRGIEAAHNEGIKKIKFNTVLIGGFNDDEIINFANLTLNEDADVRFIELMPMYDSGDFKEDSFIDSKIVLEKLKQNNIEYEALFQDNEQVAHTFKIKNAKGRIGLISPVSNSFCAYCNRIRLTSDGKIKPCLHSCKEISVKGLVGSELDEKIKEAILSKPKEHNVLSYKQRSEANRNMNEIGG